MTKPVDDHIRLIESIAPGKCIVERRRGDEVTVGVASTPEDGKPLAPGSELVHVENPNTEVWQRITVIFKAGPAQVATPAYREGYDRIFGGNRKTAEA